VHALPETVDEVEKMRAPGMIAAMISQARASAWRGTAAPVVKI
jgi:hypothetical protein